MDLQKVHKDLPDLTRGSGRVVYGDEEKTWEDRPSDGILGAAFLFAGPWMSMARVVLPLSTNGPDTWKQIVTLLKRLV